MSELVPNTNRSLSQQTESDAEIDESYDSIDLLFDDEIEVENTMQISTSFEPMSDAYPLPFQGSLEDACKTAFHVGGTEGHPAVLAYIYHQDSPFKKEVYNIMCVSKEIIFYLNTNYIIWPYDITSESNRSTLVTMWTKMFSTEFFHRFSLNQYPLLIGIMPLYGRQTNAGITIEYQFRTLVVGNWLKRHSETINRDIFFNHLKNFKAQCDHNVKNLSFSFVEKSRLSWELISEIAQYLSLNDSIAAFSMDIIPLLKHYRAKLQLSKIDYLLQRIFSQVPLEQIVSLRLNAYQVWTTAEYRLFSHFTRVKSLTLRNLIDSQTIKKYTKHLPSLTCLSLIYTTQVQPLKLVNLLKQWHDGVTCLEIHCAGILCEQEGPFRPDQLVVKPSIEYFLFNMSYGFIAPMTIDTTQDADRYFPARQFIETMPNIRRIRLIGHKRDLSEYCDDDPWVRMMRKCPRLKIITLEGVGYSPEEEYFFARSTSKIQTILRNLRPEIIFQMKFLTLSSVVSSYKHTYLDRECY